LSSEILLYLPTKNNTWKMTDTLDGSFIFKCLRTA
jgi:hypothetical protein